MISGGLWWWGQWWEWEWGWGWVAKPCRGKDGGAEGRRGRHDESRGVGGGGRPTADQAGGVTLPSIRLRVGDLQEVGGGERAEAGHFQQRILDPVGDREKKNNKKKKRRKKGRKKNPGDVTTLFTGAARLM